MNVALKRLAVAPKFNRSISVSQQYFTKKWRTERSLPLNHNAEGILTDGPDYTFLDGRPTPLLQKQKKRMLRNQEYASQIVTYCSELEFAKQKHQNELQAKKEERETILRDRLKPKGNAFK